MQVRIDQSYKQMKVMVNTQAHQIIHLRKRISDRLGGRGVNDFYIHADRLYVEAKFDNNYLHNFDNYRSWEVTVREPRFKGN